MEGYTEVPEETEENAGKPDNKGDTEKQTQQVEDLTKIPLKKEPLCVGIDDEELPHGWMVLARQVSLWFLIERNALSRA